MAPRFDNRLGTAQRRLGRGFVASVGVDLPTHEGAEDHVESPLREPTVPLRKAQVRQVDALVEPPECRGEPGPQRVYGVVVQIGQQALGDDHQSLGRIQGLDEGLEAARPARLEDVRQPLGDIPQATSTTWLTPPRIRSSRIESMIR